MEDQVIKDSSNVRLGRIHQGSDGRQQLIDRGGTVRGTYDAKTDLTRDRGGMIVGRSGNQLTRLL